MKKRRNVLLLLATMGVLLIVGPARVSAGDGYDISWWTVDGGGGESSGGDYVLSGTLGQPDTGEMAGGDYALSGGFWHPIMRHIYLPLILR